MGKVTEDEYEFAMTITSKRKSYKPALRDCKTLELWDKLNPKKFGFIPLGDLFISILTNSRTKDRTLTAIARNIQMQVALTDISLSFIHILGKNNSVAALLSRGDITPDTFNK